jgi:glycosyltransferase involved in cell wall biosynthesis
VKILHLIRTLDPSYGGPVFGLIAVASKMIEQGHDVDVATLDKQTYSTYKFNVIQFKKTFLNYGFNLDFFIWLKKNHTKYDLIFVNGVWQFHSLAIALVGRKKYFLFTHGMLDPWFQEKYIFKHIKKYIYWLFFERLTLKNSIAVLFISKDEQKLATKSFPFHHYKSKVIGFGLPEIKKPIYKDFKNSSFYNKITKRKKLLLHIGRIDHKKGTDILLEIFKKYPELKKDFVLIIGGYDHNSWARKLFNEYCEIIDNKNIFWLGPISNNERSLLLHMADFFVLPSHSENFGLVIPEALSVGLPVLISNKVNIYETILKYNAGFVFNDNTSSFYLGIKKLLSLDQSEIRSLNVSAKKCFYQEYNLDTYIQKLIKLRKYI